MDAFFGVIKVFLEKHLIPTVISLVLTVLSIVIVPSLSFLQQKIDVVLFWVFVFCCWFLVIHFFKWLVSKIRVGNSRFERYERNAADTSKAIHEFYDRLLPDE